jgi:phosphoenolpyruvate carboxylase
MANIAEQLHGTHGSNPGPFADIGILNDQIQHFLDLGIDKPSIHHALSQLHMDLVLTAHPTEITRRTIIEKQNRIFHCLRELESRKLDQAGRDQIITQLTQLIAQWWHTDEIRTEKPSPVDEAVWGFAVIESSLWEAVPQFVNQLVKTVEGQLGLALPIEFAPIRITSWMGGDRDGNPNVTAEVTEEVIRLARWKAADLFLNDINKLISELSMNNCSPSLRETVGNEREPYRAILKNLRTLLQNTLDTMDDFLKGRETNQHAILESSQQLWQPLLLCYQSLRDCGMTIIAEGLLRDTLRRAQCFGCHLLRLDIRQESGRHAQVLSEITRALSLGDYAKWGEDKRQEFLQSELGSQRPLIPRHWHPSDEVKETLNTFATLARQPRESLGAYIISMAKVPSDILAVQLLLNEFNCPALPIAPLFETLNDLNHAADVMRSLLKIKPYRDSIENIQMIMIGYSDSAKDAGVMSASWAQYRAQEALIKLCDEENVQLTLFHGRGGTTGRGGAPAEAALLSQPPGSLKNGLRVTEQGEMIRFKLGLPEKAVNTFCLYARAMLQSNLTPPPNPEPAWRSIVDELANISAKAYRELVFEQPQFLQYFHSATPINELSQLPLGSRPAKRKSSGGVESLRAIPWSFAWSQNRLMLPAWYGAGEALEHLIDQGKRLQLESMCQQWPFFSTRISMLEMVYAKTDAELSAYYESRLVNDNLKPFGAQLRERLQKDISLVLSIVNDDHLLRDLPWLKESLKLRDTYIDPLNLLQVDLLVRDRQASNKEIQRALMVTIAGVAAGLRNTG